MAEYIERSKAIKEINDAYEYDFPTASGEFDEFVSTIVPNILRNIPAADVVEIKHGYWKDTEYGTCSVCNRSISEIYDADSSMTTNVLLELTACPFCGAKMDKKG